MKPEIRYGLINGILTCAWIFAEYLLGLHTRNLALGQIVGYGSHLIPLATLYFLLRQKRDAHPLGELSLATGIIAGLWSSLVAAMIVYCFSVVYYQQINPGWLEGMLNSNVAQWRAAGKSEPEIRSLILSYRAAYSPAGLVATAIGLRTLFGGVYSVALTLVLRLVPRADEKSGFQEN